MLEVRDFDIFGENIDPFGENTSTVDALSVFVDYHQKTMRSLMMACRPEETKAFIRAHKDNPEEFRNVAREWLDENFMNFVL